MSQLYDVASSYKGLRELPGKLHNPTILGWLKKHALNIGRWGKSRDETAWCAVFVSHVLEACGYEATNDARAVSYKTWGVAANPKRGAIIVIRQRKQSEKNPTGSNRGGYHVLFLDKITKHHYWGVGGNQKNRVSRAAFNKRGWELVACRQPHVGVG